MITCQGYPFKLRETYFQKLFQLETYFIWLSSSANIQNQNICARFVSVLHHEINGVSVMDVS